ncbi:MAG: hypothetical protein A2516_07575 [Alphaproteobacteria bacterium RIFOXYD12_FULL_60_8]|nr:MAG: hypothetical protein A2516_07575 [Alphaproteobacteria bacterium RIFOXYD12_FULL_60_8]
MQKTNVDLRSSSDEDFLRDVEAVMAHLRSVGAKYFIGAIHEEEEVLDLALDIAEEARKRMHAQKQRISHLEELSVTDEMTGALNRRGFEARLREEVSRAARHGEEGLLIYVDLNRFKPINDTYGHAAGDEVLRHAATLITRAVRDTDVVGRLGGDEFAVLMPRTPHLHALARARELRSVLNSAYITWQGEAIALSASVGVSTYSGTETWEVVLSLADQDMYLEKSCASGSIARLPHRAASVS